MKLKHTMIVITLGVFIGLMAGCGSSKKPEQEPDAEKVKEAVLTIEFSENDKATAVNSMYEGSTYLTNVVVKTDQKITDLKFMNAELANADGEVAEFYVNSTGYDQKELSPDDSLVYATEFPGSAPSNLMSYMDITGEEKILSLSMSGKDGSAVVSEAAVIERPVVSNEAANVSVYYVSDDELNGLSEYYTIIDPAFAGEEHKPYIRNVIFKTDAPISEFKILDCEIGMCTDDSTEMIVHDVAYEYGDVDGKTPIIIQTTFPGSASVRGISYIDTTGEEKALILSESGNDGSLVVQQAYIKH